MSKHTKKTPEECREVEQFLKEKMQEVLDFLNEHDCPNGYLSLTLMESSSGGRIALMFNRHWEEDMKCPINAMVNLEN